MSISNRWAIQRIFDMRVKDVSTDVLEVLISDLKTAGLESNQENIYSEGGAGNSYITSHSFSKRLTGTAEAATYYNEMLSLLTGTDVVTGATTLSYVDGFDTPLVVNSDAATSTYTAVGTTGAEIVSLFEYNSDGSLGTQYTQVSGAPATGEFSWAAGTFAFFSGDIVDGTRIIANYYIASGASTHTITSNVNEFSKIVKIELVTLVQDACSGVEYAAVLTIPKAKLDGSVLFDLASDGAVGTMNVSFEALKASCISNELWDLKISDEAEWV
jgi:roadblock/LC7 domain-containing protein